MMKKPKYLFYLILIVFGAQSCEPDEGMVLDIEVVNGLDQDIELVSFRTPSSGATVYDSILITSGRLHLESFFDEINPYYYPIDLHCLFLGGDSIEVWFNDTLRITHIKSLSADPSAGVDYTRIYVRDARSLYNAQSFTRKKVDESFFRGVYVIDSLDLDYALSAY